MITAENKDIAQWTMSFALANGCSSARVSIIVANNSSFEYRNTQLDKLHKSVENKLYLEIFVDGKYGSFSTNRIEKRELNGFITQAVESTRFLAADRFRCLPSVERYYKSDGKSLDLYDDSFDNLSTDVKLDLVRQTVEEIYGTNDQIISVIASYDDGCSAEYMIASNGFEAETKDTGFSIAAEVALLTPGDARPESYWYDSRIYWTDLKKEGIARHALQRAMGKIGQQKIKSGKYNMLLDNTVSARLLSPIVSAMYGSVLQQKNSFLLGKMDTKIVSDKLTLIDTPHVKRSFGARWFDGEGVATPEQTKIIENGFLKTFFIDTYHSLKMDVAPTIASPSIVTARLGEDDFEGMLRKMWNGIWVTGFNGGNSNPTTGDFSFGVEGFLIEGGIVKQPIGEMNITGNLLELWSNMQEVGNDPRDNSSWRIPSVLFSEVNFSGL